MNPVLLLKPVVVIVLPPDCMLCVTSTCKGRRQHDTCARWKMITDTVGLCTENKMQIPRPLQYNKSNESDNEIYCLDKLTVALVEV